jgi:hypothetical protein
VGLAGLRVFSGLVFEPLIAGNAVSYGALGTVLIVQSWLIGVGWVVYGGQLFGRWSYESWLQPRADSRRGHGKASEQDPGSQNTPPGLPAAAAANTRRSERHGRLSGNIGVEVTAGGPRDRRDA